MIIIITTLEKLKQFLGMQSRCQIKMEAEEFFNLFIYLFIYVALQMNSLEGRHF